MTDPYKILDVDYAASDSEVKKAYYALARKYHPDNFADDAARADMANRKMREINAAYEQILADRAHGTVGAPPSPPPPPPPRGAERAAPRTAGAEQSAPGFCGYPRGREMIDLGMHAPAYGELCRVQDGDRTAEGHYLAALAHHGMRHMHDAVREINLAVRTDRKNPEYRKARDAMRHRTGDFAPKPAPERKSKKERPKKKRGLISRCLLRLLGMDDGKF